MGGVFRIRAETVILAITHHSITEQIIENSITGNNTKITIIHGDTPLLNWGQNKRFFRFGENEKPTSGLFMLTRREAAKRKSEILRGIYQPWLLRDMETLGNSLKSQATHS